MSISLISRLFSSFILITLFFVSPSHASANSWEITFFGQQSSGGTFVSSPSAHCQSINQMPASGITDGRTYTGANFIGYLNSQGQLTTDQSSIRGARCEFYHPWYSSPWRAAYTLAVDCLAPAEIDTVTGECRSPVDETGDQTWSGGEIVFSQQLKQCVKYPNLPPEEFCKFMTGKHTGNTHLEATSGDA